MSSATPAAGSTKTPAAAPVLADEFPPLPELQPAELADLLNQLPDDVGEIALQQITTAAGSATVVYLDDPTAVQPKFGMIVAITVEATTDADGLVAALQRTRWGDPKDHMVTASSAGDEKRAAFREFWRTFAPGMFMIPNLPVYFLIWCRPLDHVAFMVIGATAALRLALAEALVATLESALATPASPVPVIQASGE